MALSLEHTFLNILLPIKRDCVKIRARRWKGTLLFQDAASPFISWTRDYWGFDYTLNYSFTGDTMPPSFLTPTGYKKLQDELEQLRTVKRQEVAARLREAMEDGGDMGVDLDAEYEAAKNEQAFVEGRIQELEMLLANARVIENSGKREVVEVGATVTIKEGRSTP